LKKEIPATIGITATMRRPQQNAIAQAEILYSRFQLGLDTRLLVNGF
jgi:hypothetical protein